MNHEEQQFQIPADLLLITNESGIPEMRSPRDPFGGKAGLSTEDTHLASFLPELVREVLCRYLRCRRHDRPDTSGLFRKKTVPSSRRKW